MQSRPVRWLREAFAGWQRHDCLNIGAALAYYALFSIFPLILVILSIVGLVIDPREFEVQQRIVALIGSQQVRDLVIQTLEELHDNGQGAGLVGFITLLLAASGIFAQLDKAFDTIWELPAPPPGRGVVGAAMHMARQRLLSFALVAGCAVLMLASGLAAVLVRAAGSYTAWLPGQALLLQWAQFLISLLVLAAAAAAMFRYLPGRHVAWRNVSVAALLTALLFSALQQVVGLYLSTTNYAAYGAVGGVMALLLWIFLTCQVLLFGAELSRAWAVVYGRRPPAG